MKPRSRPLLVTALQFALACTIAGAVSYCERQDANWDLGNYHLYNPWAWLTGRYGFDLAPAQLQTFHNPLVDVPFYAMVAADWPPWLIGVLMALPAGVAWFATAKAAAILFRDCAVPLRRAAVATAILIGATGTAGIATIGNTMNEWPNAALIAIALWRLVADVANDALRLRTVLLAGLLAGVAVGLKLTAAVSATALAIALLMHGALAAGIRNAVVFGAAALAGFVLVAGRWMLLMYELYASPLFPYFNTIFRSPLFPAEAVLDQRFGPKSALQWLALPFTLLQPPAGYVQEVLYRDPRLPLLATLVLATVALRVLAPARVAPFAAATGTRAAWRLIAIFIGAGFVAWAVVFSYYRYLLPLELVSGIAIVGLALRIVPARLAAAAAFALALATIAATDQPNWGRVAWGRSFVEIRIPPIQPRALVVLTEDAPMAYVLIAFPSDARHVGIHNNIVRADRRSGLRDLAARIVAEHRGPIYQLSTAERPGADVLEAYGLRRNGSCAAIRSNLDLGDLTLCALERTR